MRQGKLKLARWCQIKISRTLGGYRFAADRDCRTRVHDVVGAEVSWGAAAGRRGALVDFGRVNCRPWMGILHVASDDRVRDRKYFRGGVLISAC
jgi:hypothetical protein